jgi:hypothetical protein
MQRICLFTKEPTLSIEIIASRQYGEEKLTKPIELKGIKQSFSVDWIAKKCKCKVFVNPDKDNLYILHRDFNSVELHGHGHQFRNKFIYNDSFGSVVLRGEAWLKLTGLKQDMRQGVATFLLPVRLAEQITGEHGNCEWERFFEAVIKSSTEWEEII